MEQQKYFPPDFTWDVTTVKYPAGDPREHAGTTRTDHRDKKARITFDLRDFHFSPEQRERFVFLMGPRYQGSHVNKIVCAKFLTFQENYLKCVEQLREIYWEALRAPSRCATLTRNPYRRESLIKKRWGKTKEERTANMQAEKLEQVAHKAAVDQQILDKEIYETDVVGKERSLRRRELAKRRQKLGFNDKGADEADDDHMEYLEKVKGEQI